jgi:hypothetical protein
MKGWEREGGGRNMYGKERDKELVCAFLISSIWAVCLAHHSILWFHFPNNTYINLTFLIMDCLSWTHFSHTIAFYVIPSN